MKTRDYGLFLPAESMYDPEERRSAESGLATQKAAYESQMDSFYTELAAKLGMFEKELGFEKEKWGDTVGLEEKRLSLDELLGMRGLDIDEAYKTGALGVEREGLALQELLGMRGLDIDEAHKAESLTVEREGLALQELLGMRGLDIDESHKAESLTVERESLALQELLGMRGLDIDEAHKTGALDVERESLALQELLGMRELDLREDELGFSAISELLPYAWAEKQQYEQDLKNYKTLESNILHGYGGRGVTPGNLQYLRSQSPGFGPNYDLDAIFDEYLR